tara:strand:- start:627 stop:1667 length:1041 start_codon:yes stop_codon:yes gene_type:complete
MSIGIFETPEEQQEFVSRIGNLRSKFAMLDAERQAALGDPSRLNFLLKQEQQKKFDEEFDKLDPQLQSIYRLFGKDVVADIMFPDEPSSGTAKIGSLWKDAKTGTQFREVIVGNKILFKSPSTGQTYSLQEMKDLFPGIRPATAGEATRLYQSIGEVRKESKELLQTSQGIDRLNNYLDNLRKTPIGIERLYNNFTTAIKTLAADNDLTEQQVAQKIAQGNLQGLVGANRIEIAGPGVLTEQDWQRILDALGGETGPLQNPNVVFPLINEILQDKIELHNEQAEFYNYAIDTGNYGQAFKRKDIITFTPRSYLPEGATPGSKLIDVEGNILFYERPDGSYFEEVLE